MLYIANKGIILCRQGNYQKGLKYCEEAISKNPDREAGYYAKACYYALQNHDLQAIKNLNKAIDIAPHRCHIEPKNNPDFDQIRNNPKFKALLGGE